MNRKKKLILNTACAFALQFVTFLCGFILPRQFLLHYGSEVNGLVNSITGFLSVISLMELGVGAVVQSNLYKPLAEQDVDKISKIARSSSEFYKKIAYIFLGYIAVLFFVFPNINGDFSPIFTDSLLLIIAFSTFAQYYFGITYQVLLNADQRSYIYNTVQIGAIVCNTVISLCLMHFGCSVHIVKLVSALIFVVRPLFQNIYVRKKYHLHLKIPYTEEPIKQKWNGFAQHLSAVVTGEIDIILLTVIADYQSVSIYSVYFMIVSGMTNLVMLSASGLESYWGNMLAKGEKKLLLASFEKVESLVHAGVTFLFTVTAVLIAPFISVYVRNIPDAGDYDLPLFGILLTFAYAVQCLRIPYFRIIKAAGHYKQTQNGAFITAGLNIAVSLALIFKFGLVGIAIGTLCAMLYHTVYFAWYIRKNILCRPFSSFVWHMLVDLLSVAAIFCLTHWFTLQEVSYGAWTVLALKTVAVSLAVIGIAYLVFYGKHLPMHRKKDNIS